MEYEITKNDDDLFIKNSKEIMIFTDEDRELPLEDLYNNLRSNNLAFMIFFNRWG